MNLFWRRKQQELKEELDSHLRMAAQEHVERGEEAAQAQQSARRELGNATLIRETTRDVWGWRWLETLLQDLRYALRMLRKSPGFTAVAVLTLALGIGANTAIFSIVDAVLLRPLPFKDPSRLVVLHEGIPKMGYPKMDFAVPDLEVFLRAQNSFSAVGVYEGEHLDVTGRGEPERISAARVSASLFLVLGVEPVLGRNFSAAEDAPGHPVAILSYSSWQRHFGGVSNIIGQSITLDRHPYEIVGVMPRDFTFPLPSAEFNSTPADVWVPMAYTPDELQDWGGAYIFGTIGRLKPGVTLEQARAEAVSVSNRIIDSYPAAIAGFARNGGLNVMIVPLQQDVVGSVRPLLLVLMAAVSFVLLIACANIATLLLSRAASRNEEIAVRTALGATRLRLLRQFFTESLVLSLLGGALGLFLASWARDVILTLVPSSILLPHEVPLSKPVLAFAFGVSILCAFLFGLAPAFQVSSFSLQHSLREGGGAAKTSRRRFRLQGLFVTAEFALALVLLIASGLLIRSFAKLLETNPGFRPEHVLTMSIPLPRTIYTQPANVQNFYLQLLDKVSNLPGIQDASISNVLPLHGCEMVSFTPEGQVTDQALKPQAICQTWVMGNYLETMGIPLLKGRWFTPEDRAGAQQVALVSESTAKKFWPGQEPLGKRLRWGLKGPWQVVVGIVGNVKEQGLNIPFAPQVYRPYLQMNAGFLEQDPFGDGHARYLDVRTAADPAALTSTVIAQIHSLDSQLAVANINTMTQVFASSVAAPKFNTLLLGTFAGLALFLAAIGVYGVLAYSVAQQTHDIGIRIALGAQPRDVLRMILEQGARVTIAGVIIGLLASFALTRLLSAFLYGVTATDPLTFAGVTILLLAVALAACYIPARRAMKVDPMVALRYE
jgi:predicted permease